MPLELCPWGFHRQALLTPCVRAAGNIDDVVPSQCIFQITAHLHGTATALADDRCILIRFEFLIAVRNVTHRNMFYAISVVNRVVIVLPDVDKLGIFRNILWWYLIHKHHPTFVW